jgi:prepilin-type N-terminal cleavage/methylation domain-containing protein
MIKHNRPAGFTLVELTMVLSILSVMLLCVFPALREAFAEYTIYACARQMASDIRSHQQAAISAEEVSVTYQISFDEEDDTYNLKRGLTSLQMVYLPSSVDMETNFPDKELKFSILGVPVGPGGNVFLQDRVTGKQYFVIVSPVVGRVRVDTRPPD